ncbi:MAG: alpha-mannosidase [Kiritimatiellae bacterium]|nr:alpha-mannosidase [Kiritimatiellia bacterium]
MNTHERESAQADPVEETDTSSGKGARSRARQYCLVGLTHIDLAWLHDRRYYERCQERVLVCLLDCLDSDPEFTYAIEQMAHYRALEKKRPDLIRRLRGYVEAGRVEVAGAMASSLDTNGPNGECYVRNHLLGRAWARAHLGADVAVGELVDTFGISAQTPQIHRQFGLRYLFANRLGGNVPDSFFAARGIDGSTILMAGPDAHTPAKRPARVHMTTLQGREEHVERLLRKGVESPVPGPHLLISYDENENVPMTCGADRMARYRSMPETSWRFTTLREFFRAMETSGLAWPTRPADLNPAFTGCYGLRPFVRLRNRAVETRLLEAEKWAALAGTTDWRPSFQEAWWTMAYIHSHDVYSGSFPGRTVRPEVQQWLDRVERTATAILDDVLGARSESAEPGPGKRRVAVFNGLPWPRRDLAETELPEGWAGIETVEEGDVRVPFELCGDKVRFPADSPSVGSRTYTLIRGDAAPAPALARTDRAVLENEFLRVECSACDGLERIVLAGSGEPVVSACGGLLLAQEDKGSYQIDNPCNGEVPAAWGSMELFRAGRSQAGGALVLKGAFPELRWAGEGNRLVWELEFALRPGKPRLDMTVRIDWVGESSRVRLHLPTAIDRSEGIFEIPFGIVRRRPYSVRSTCHGEWPAHRFVAVEDGRHGVALVNTGTIGAEVCDGSIRTTLFRAPAAGRATLVPDDTSSQHGRHTFRFAVVPYRGALRDSPVFQAAQEVNTPLWVRPAAGEAAECTSFLCLQPHTCVLSAVKAPEDGAEDDLIVRLYESAGQATDATLSVHRLRQAWHSNLLEEKSAPACCGSGNLSLRLTPFEIKTVRIRRAPPAGP